MWISSTSVRSVFWGLSLSVWMTSCAVVQPKVLAPAIENNPPTAEAIVPVRDDRHGFQARSRRAPVPHSFLAACRARATVKRVYMIGASSTGSLTGPALRRAFRKTDIQFKFWGKASSGLARPDFHDWPKETRRIVRRFKPDVVIVHLGTNDKQVLRKGKRWIRPRSDAWSHEYAARVKRMLEIIGGPEKKRPVIWISPVRIRGKKALDLGGRITRLMGEQVALYAGPAVYMDVFDITSLGGRGQLKRMKNSKGKWVDVYQGDGAHLTSKANNLLVTDPIKNWVDACAHAASLSNSN